MNNFMFDLLGWVFFLLGSVVYTVHGLIQGDLLSALGGLAFVIGCICFMVPIVHYMKKKK